MDVHSITTGKCYSHPALSGYFRAVSQEGELWLVCWFTRHGTPQGFDRIKLTEKFLEEAYETLSHSDFPGKLFGQQPAQANL